MNTLGNIRLENLNTSRETLDFWESPVETNTPEGISEKTKAYAYLQEIMEEIGDLASEAQIRKLRKFSEDNYMMYRAAADLVKELENESAFKRDLIFKKIGEIESKINKKEKELNILHLEKDYLLMQESMHAPGKTPEIKIKNEICKGTVIIGKYSDMRLEKSIYGVRICEQLETGKNASKITISGYFE